MRTRILALLALGVSGVIAVGVALATPPSGVTPGPFHARGSAQSLRVVDRDMRLKLKAKEPTDVQIVSATLGPNGFTGWHEHNGPSIAIVKSGQITMYVPDDRGRGRGGCEVTVLNAGTLFAHPKGAHNFVNTASGATEFYIVYFLPPGSSPAPIDVTPAPAGCPT